MENNGDENTQGNGAGERRAPLPRKIREIEIRLQFPYRRVLRRDRSLSHWAWVSNVAEFSTRVYPDPDRGTITIAVFDERTNRSIKEWSGQVKMTGDWEQRLSRAAGLSMVLAQRWPWCPKCSEPLALRERHDGSCQFFGCPSYPKCDGSISLVDHDIDRKKAANMPARAVQERAAPNTAHAT